MHGEVVITEISNHKLFKTFLHDKYRMPLYTPIHIYFHIKYIHTHMYLQKNQKQVNKNIPECRKAHLFVLYNTIKTRSKNPCLMKKTATVSEPSGSLFRHRIKVRNQKEQYSSIYIHTHTHTQKKRQQTYKKYI